MHNGVLWSSRVGGHYHHRIISYYHYHCHDHIILQYHYHTGGWWFSSCGYAHLTGQHTKSKTTVGGKNILYYYGGDRIGDVDSWKEAEMEIFQQR